MSVQFGEGGVGLFHCTEAKGEQQEHMLENTTLEGAILDYRNAIFLFPHSTVLNFLNSLPD